MVGIKMNKIALKNTTNAEVLNFLKHMKNEKSPGPYGFTCEFFIFFSERYWHAHH
jgi:hypothetical protein